MAIDTIIQDGRGWETAQSRPSFEKSVFHLNLFRDFRVFMSDASQKRKDNEYRKRHQNERTR